jgi:hypothetical protein
MSEGETSIESFRGYANGKRTAMIKTVGNLLDGNSCTTTAF